MMVNLERVSLMEKARGNQAQEEHTKDANQVKREDILSKLDIARENAKQRK